MQREEQQYETRNDLPNSTLIDRSTPLRTFLGPNSLGAGSESAITRNVAQTQPNTTLQITRHESI